MFTDINNTVDIYTNYENKPLNFVICYKKQLDQKDFDLLHNLTKENPKLKVFLNITIQDINNSQNFKNVIKFALLHDCTGFLITVENCVSEDEILRIKKLNSLLNKLPDPYNFDWEVYIKSNKDKSIIAYCDNPNKSLTGITIPKNNLNSVNVKLNVQYIT